MVPEGLEPRVSLGVGGWELGVVAAVASWLSGFGGHSKTPWVRVPCMVHVAVFSISIPFSPSRLISN